MQPKGLLTFTQLGQYGRLGNQLFQIAATIGLAIKNGLEYTIPPWEYARYFDFPPKQGNVSPDIEVVESTFHYADITLDKGRVTDLKGYFQSEFYFQHCAALIREKFDFAKDTQFSRVNDKYSWIPKKIFPACAVHVRRGDYVNNPDYAQIPLDYYENAIKRIPEDCPFAVFSDDIAWCDTYLRPIFGRRTFWLIQGNSEIEDLFLMSQCQHFIIANSSFSWWGAWLGEKYDSQIIAPNEWFSPTFELTHNSKDIIPSHWNKISWREPSTTHQKIDLRDVTFTIPVKYDHPDREKNLRLVIDYIFHHFDTHIVVTESCGELQYFRKLVMAYCQNPNFRHYYSTDHVTFHRTRYLNEMAKNAETPIIANWDADVLCSAEQILAAVEKIRKGAAGCYPYDGRFMNVNRAVVPALKESLDIRSITEMPLNYKQIQVTSVGGAVLWSRAEFMEGGMENERMISYGPEDYERFERFTKLGYPIERVAGPLFHIDHWRGKNSSDQHSHFEANTKEFDRIGSLSKEQLAAEVITWPWMPRPMVDVPDAFCPLHMLEMDAHYLVNLKRRPDRLAKATQELQKLGLANVQVFYAQDGAALKLSHPEERITPGMVGCFQTHKVILKEALERNYHSILILEDDFKPIDGFNQLLEIMLPQLPDDWQFVYWGYTEYAGFGSHKAQIAENWVIPNCGWGTQGYMIRTRDAIHKIWLALQKQTMQLDEQLTQVILPYSGLKYYACFPSIIDQHIELGTDIQNVEK